MARRKNVKRIDPRYFLHETVNRGEEEKEPGVGGQPPEWERKLAKSEPKVARSKRRHVRRLEDPDVDVEELEEKRIGSMLDPKTYKHPDPEDPNWPWKPGDSVEGNRPHPYEAEPVLGSLKKRPGESREEYERRIRKGKHRAQYRLPDEGELDPYELEESWADDDAGGYDRQWKAEQGYKVKGPHVPAKNSREEQEERARERRRRRVRGGELEEGCPHAEEGDALDISSPGIEVHVDDISNLPPEEAFAAGLAAAKDAIDHMLSVPEQVPPEGEGPLQERSRLNEAEGETPEDVAQRISNMPAMFRHSVINDIRYMAEGSKEMIGYYPHVENHVEFAQAVLRLMGEG